MTVTRCAGLPVQVAGLHFMVGCGYEGTTKELDNTVTEAARLLSESFNRDVVIRFNSNRQSGRAWLKNSVLGFDGNCQIGLGAGIACAGHTCGLPENAIYIDTMTYASALKDKSLATEGCRYSEPYHWQYHSTLQEAIAWLKKHVDRNAILS